MSASSDDSRRSALDETVTSWPDVRAKPVFGHRAWVRNGSMFGFLADSGVAVKLIAPIDPADVLARDGVELFAYGGKRMAGWAVLPLRDDAELDEAVQLVHTAFEAVVG